MAVTTFPDTLELLRVHLEARLGVPAGDRLPTTWPAGGYLELERTGGTRDRLADDAQITLNAWHPSSPATAERIAGAAVSEVIALSGRTLEGWQVLGTGNTGGVAADPDPRFPDMHRAAATIRLRVRGVTN